MSRPYPLSVKCKITTYRRVFFGGVSQGVKPFFPTLNSTHWQFGTTHRDSLLYKTDTSALTNPARHPLE